MITKEEQGDSKQQRNARQCEGRGLFLLIAVRTCDRLLSFHSLLVVLSPEICCIREHGGGGGGGVGLCEIADYGGIREIIIYSYL